MAADDRVAELIVRLDPGDSVAKANALRQALGGVADAGDKVSTTQEKVTRAFSAGSADKWIASMNAGEGAAMRLANGLDKLRRLEEQGEVTERQRGVILDQLTGKYMTALQAIERKAEAEKKAAQAVKEAADTEKRARLDAIGAIDKQFGALLKLQDAQKAAATSRQAGDISLKQEVDLREKATLAYRSQIQALEVQEVAMRKSTTSTGLARHEFINLSRQLQDVSVSLAGGQSPFRILIEQGSQIADIFISSKAKIADVFATIGANIRSMSSGFATAGIVGFVATMIAGAGAAALAWLSAQKDVELALLGIGKASGATAESINKIANAGATTFGLSISEAREFATIIAQTGKVGVDQLQPMVDIGKNLAVVLGTTTTEAAKQLASALVDPAKGVEQINAKLGQFDAATTQVIKNLAAQNKILEAQKVLFDGIALAAKGAQDAISANQNFWTMLGNVISNAADKLGEFIAKTNGFGRGTEDQLAALIEEYQSIQQKLNAPFSDKEFHQAELDKVAAQIGLLNAQIERTPLLAKAAQDNLKSLADQKMVRDVSPEIAQFETLKNQADGLADLLARIQRTGGEDFPILEAIGQSLKQVELSAARAKEAFASALTPIARMTQEFEVQKAAIEARTGAERAAVVARQTMLQFAGQEVGLETKKLAVEQQVTLELTRQAQQHRDNMAALQDQLSVAKARPGAAQQAAQYEADINSRLREGATLMQAETEAALKRAATVAQANRAVDQQIISMRQAVEMERARLEGTEAATAAAQAYANAMRAGASETKAAALAAATLETNLERAQIAAEAMANQMSRSGAAAGSLEAKLANIGTGGRSFDAGTHPFSEIRTSSLVGGGRPGLYMPSNVIPGGGGSFESSEAVRAIRDAFAEAGRRALTESIQKMLESTPGTLQYEEAAQKQIQAAEAQQRAADQQLEAAKAAREAQIAQLDDQSKDILATKILAGLTPQQINAQIESGQVQFGSAQQRFEAQLDLYKRAGMSNAQTAADIRAGLIGEGVRPSELLAALDRLTDSVDSNTSAQLGLSPFYTSQGDRALGYRGYTVQKGATNIPGAGGGTIPIGGTGGGGTGGIPLPGGGTMPGGGGMGSIPNTGPVALDGTPIGSGPGGVVVYQRILNGLIVEGYYENGDPNRWVTTRVISVAPGITTPPNTNPLTDPVRAPTYPSFARPPPQGGVGNIGPSSGFTRFAEGGVVDQPTMAMFGEAGPEAFVPLRGGAIPVKLIDRGRAANNNGPTNVININAPLVHFAAEPTREEVKESGFQASQMLRRQMAG